MMLKEALHALAERADTLKSAVVLSVINTDELTSVSLNIYRKKRNGLEAIADESPKQIEKK